MSDFSFMSIRFSSTYFLPSSRVSGVTSFITSSSYSDLPTMAPNAIAMGRPIIPVPGIPTPMAFFRMFALSSAVIFSGLHPSVSVARAVQSATAMGSVQPTAGTTSRCISAIILCLIFLSNMLVCFYSACFFLNLSSPVCRNFRYSLMSLSYERLPVSG